MDFRYSTLEDLVLKIASGIRPPENLSVVEAAEKYVKLHAKGGYIGPFQIDKVPYLAEPMECLASQDYRSVIFVGPSQCAKSTIGEMWLAHTAKCDPADMMVVCMNKEEARDLKISRIDRLFRYSPEIDATKSKGRNKDNVFDVHFNSGMLLRLRGPTVATLSGKPVPRLWLNDFDRWPADIDGEGSGFLMAMARTTTFGRNGMVLVEASPGFEIDNPRWEDNKSSLHQGPPATGIVSLYNQGDRRRWYWQCPSCQESFEPHRSLLRWGNSEDIKTAAESAHLACPHCGHIIVEEGDRFGEGKFELNKKGRWLRDGQKWLPDGSIVGEGVVSDSASFWLFGIAAAFSDWKSLVTKYLNAEKDFAATADTTSMQGVLTTGFGEVFCSKSALSSRLPEDLKARAKDGGERVVPRDVRFLLATIDCQKNRFEVQITGISANRDFYVIDRFPIRKSRRLDVDNERYPISPHTHIDDWIQLIDDVMLKTYPLDGDPNRVMGIHHTAVDSQGLEGVTAKAYEFWRMLRENPDFPVGMQNKFTLLRGTRNLAAPRVSIIYPDSQDKGRKNALSRGDIPVMQVNGTMVKDQLSAMLDKKDIGGGYVHFPKWLPNWFYEEMCAEIRTPKGWENPKRARNEAWDLLVYALALCLSNKVNLDRLDWDNPPSWAEEWDVNSLVFGVKEEIPFTKPPENDITIEELAGSLG